MDSARDRPCPRVPWIVATRRNFLVYWMLFTGIPVIAVGIWSFWEFGSLAFLAFVAVICALSTYCSGLLMWALFIGPRVRRRSASEKASREV